MQVFSCGFCEISKITFSYRTSRWLLLYMIIKAMIHCEIYLSGYLMKEFNAYFITFNLISWNSYKICKKETSTNHPKKICHIPMFSTSPCCGHWLTCFSWKGYSRRRLFFDYFIRDKNRTILDRTSQSTKQLIESYLLTIC